MLYLIYFLIINLLAAVVCALDKYSAINGGWRVRENTLFALCQRLFVDDVVGVFGQRAVQRDDVAFLE